MQKLVYISLKYPLPISSEEIDTECLELFYKKRNRLHIYDSPSISAYNIDEILGNNRDLSIVYGLPYSGKTVVSKFLEQKQGYTILDFAVFIETIKEIKAGPEGDKESITVDFKMFCEEFDTKLKSIPKNQRLLLENITKIVTKEDELLALLQISGPPRVYFNLECNNTPLIDRFKTITGAGDEMADEAKDEYMKTNFEFPKKIIDILSNQSIKKVNINSSNSESKTFNIIEGILGKKFILINHLYNMNLENVLYNIATTHKILYINVPQLIESQLRTEAEFSSSLKNSYNEVTLWEEKDRKNWTKEENLYYTFNPIHYDQKVVSDLISHYVSKNGKENEEQRNIVLLTGYLNNGLLPQKIQCMKLPMLEINRLLGLGTLYSFTKFNLF